MEQTNTGHQQLLSGHQLLPGAGNGSRCSPVFPQKQNPRELLPWEYSPSGNSWQDTSAKNLLSKKTTTRCHSRINCLRNAIQTAQSLDYFTGSPAIPCRASLGPYVLLSFTHNGRNWRTWITFTAGFHQLKSVNVRANRLTLQSQLYSYFFSRRFFNLLFPTFISGSMKRYPCAQTFWFIPWSCWFSAPLSPSENQSYIGVNQQMAFNISYFLVKEILPK